MKILSTLIFIVLIYILPLAGTPAQLLNPKLIVMTFFCVTLLWSQPAIDFHEAKENRNTDKRSVFAILLASALCQLVVMIEYGYFQNTPSKTTVFILTICGFLFMAGGTVFRIHSIRTLGKFFTATVQVQSNQRIIQTGPYAHLRHPSYLGAYLAFIGSALFMGSVLSAVITAILMLVVYKIRIDAEERTLVAAFEPEYAEYQAKTFRMLPYVW